jgi:hypothetical protein
MARTYRLGLYRFTEPGHGSVARAVDILLATRHLVVSVVGRLDGKRESCSVARRSLLVLLTLASRRGDDAQRSKNFRVVVVLS